ncbi:hypothetical protein [Ktedonospora formicarum]|nr:hypothetical protein [Ktedonospora formicarum]
MNSYRRGAITIEIFADKGHILALDIRITAREGIVIQAILESG